MPFQWIVFSLAAYILGSFPSGKLIAGRIARIDITKRGSGNIGATNVARELGIRWGIVTLILDIAKSFIPVLVLRFYMEGNEFGAFFIGFCALLGHQFSIFQKFRGGKGVATALGVYLALSPASLISCLIGLFIFILTVYKWDFVSLGSMVAACVIPIFLLLFNEPGFVVIGSMVMAALICYKHKENIHRILRGEENKWRRKGGQVKSSSNLSSSSSE